MQSSCILKLFEMHILQYLEEKVFFNSRQFGFKRQTSTTDACLILKETVNKYITKGGKSFCLFVDLSKAFDNIDNFRLGKLLLKRNIPPDIVLFIMFYLRNQTARIVWNGAKGSYRRIERGVRQGDMLSPFLFKLYIDDVLEEISRKGVGCKLGILRINILAYADDLVLIADNQKNLDDLYRVLDEKMQQLRLCINKAKSKAMIFTHSKRPGRPNEIVMGSDTFEVVTQYKYLGHTIQDNLHDLKDAEFRLNSFYGKFNWVFRNFKHTSLDVLIFLFNAYCSPDYGLPLWCLDTLFKKRIFKTFEVAYSNAVKRMLGVSISTSSHAAAEACSLLLFNHHCTFTQSRYFKRIFRSNNSILKLLSHDILEGYLYRSLTKQFALKYGCNMRENEVIILKSRIFWVQRHEDRTGRPLEPDIGE